MTRARTLVATSLFVLSLAGRAAAQPALAPAADVVAPGTPVAVTVTGAPGRHFALLGSATNAGFSYGGVALAVGADLVILGQGVLDATGTAVASVTPPFLGSTLDRYYLQAVTSPSPGFLPLEASAGRVVRNRDATSGIVEARVARGEGASPTLTLDFVSPTATVTIAAAGQRVHVVASRALGSIAATGGQSLTLHACARAVAPGSPFVLDDATGIMGLRVPNGTRVLNTVSHIFEGLPPGSYEVGMCGRIFNPSQANSWNDNGLGSVTAFVFQ
jgi:hypothetical protein